MTKGKIVNKNTGQWIEGDKNNAFSTTGEFTFHITGTKFGNLFALEDWDFIAAKKPLPIKDGIYLPYAMALDEDGDMIEYPNLLTRSYETWYWVGNTFCNTPIRVLNPETELDQYRDTIVMLAPKAKEDSK